MEIIKSIIEKSELRPLQTETDADPAAFTPALLAKALPGGVISASKDAVLGYGMSHFCRMYSSENHV